MPVLEKMTSLGLSDGESSSQGSPPLKMNLSPRTSNHSESEDEMAIYPLMDDGLPHPVLNNLHSAPLQSVTEEDTPDPQAHSPGSVQPRMRTTRAFSDNFDHRRSAQKFNRKIVSKWKSVAVRARSLDDPWFRFHIEDYPVEDCVRHRYSSVRKEWTTDGVQVKIMPEPFARGAMRECFRVKKLSTFLRNQTWSQAENYVAKKYIAEVDRTVIFEDVRLQMDAKLWAEEYNRHNPPKKIDIAQMTVLEFVNRPDKPLYHLEHFFEGDYIKYNSNSGFVSELFRQTPQAFSHFSFERSGHQLIVVDVQGVGDLYTDPQIHTTDGKGYGDGNLGTKGMALFFRSHLCNDICESLGLTEFDLAKTERANIKQLMEAGRFSSDSACRGSEELCVSFPAHDSDVIMEMLRHRSISMCSNHSNEDKNSMPDSNGYGSMEKQHNVDCCCVNCLDDHMHRRLNGERNSVDSDDGEVFGAPGIRARRTLVSWNQEQPHMIMTYGQDDSPPASFTSTAATQEAEREAFWAEARKKSMPSSYLDAAQIARLQQDFFDKTNNPRMPNNPFGSVLGQVHLDLSRYHELGRFVKEEGMPYDRAAAWFHLDVAAKCGVLEAIVTLAKIYLNLPHDLLEDITVDDENDENVESGINLMMQAANLGDRSSLLFMAEAYETGLRLGPGREKDWQKAVMYYERLIVAATEHRTEDDGQDYDSLLDKPIYMIQAKVAELCRQGGFGLERDPSKAGDLYSEAAESAMAEMKGKIANKFYMLSEEAYGEVEEETEE